jgi:hypothetical protein
LDEVDVVAQRTITIRDRGGVERGATIRISKPLPEPGGGPWSCEIDFVAVDGLSLTLRDASDKLINTSALKGSGIDGFQAIANAMLYARVLLNRADVDVFFLGVKDQTAMIERPICGFNISVRRYLEQLVDDAMEGIVSQLADPKTSAGVRARFPGP